MPPSPAVLGNQPQIVQPSLTLPQAPPAPVLPEAPAAPPDAAKDAAWKDFTSNTLVRPATLDAVSKKPPMQAAMCVGRVFGNHGPPDSAEWRSFVARNANEARWPMHLLSQQ